MSRKNSLTAILAVLLCACLFSLCLAESGVETDDEGGVWDYDSGIYTDPSGNEHPIEEDGEPSGPDSVIVPGEDGSIIIDTGEHDEVIQNEDGSITVESGQIQIEDPQQERAPLTQEEWEQRKADAAARNGDYTLTVYRDGAGMLHEVAVKYMGIGRSMIVLNGQEMLVNTVDLEWETEAPADKVLAVVDTPNQGYAKVYAGPNKKTTILAQCRIDTVLRVIKTNDRWTMVDYNGLRAYIQTGSLEFFTNDHTEFEAALVCSRSGKTTGRDTVNIRSRDSSERILADYQLGTPVTVFDVIDEWAEIDIEGWHCRILSKYLAMQ